MLYSREQNKKSKKALIIDHDKKNYQSIKLLLNKVILDWANSLDKAKQFLTVNNDYDFIFLNFILGQKKGIMLIPTIISTNPLAIVVGMTEKLLPEIKIQMEFAGIKKFLEKPFTLIELNKALL